MQDIRLDTNINELAAWLDELIAIHSAQKTSALRVPNVKWKLSLTNTATTTSKSGQAFDYYAAVDTGRKAVDARPGGWLVFGNSRSPVFAKRVKASAGLEITAKSLAVINATYNSELEAGLTALQTRRRTAQDFDIREFMSRANRAARQARQPGSKAPAFKLESNDFFTKFIKLTNWARVAEVFQAVTEDQVKAFQKNTPRRTSGQLAYLGKGQVEILPHDSTHLRSGFKLTADIALKSLLGDTSGDSGGDSSAAVRISDRSRAGFGA